MKDNLLTQNVSVNSKSALLHLTQVNDGTGAWTLVAEDAVEKTEIWSLSVDDIVGVNVQTPGK